MAKISTGRTSGLNYDGGMPIIAGFADTAWKATEAQTDLGKMLIPFNATIQEIIINVKGTATDTSARPLNIGTSTGVDAILAAYDVDVASAQTFVIPGTSTQLTTNQIAYGKTIEFGLGAGTSTDVTPVIGVSVVLVPQAAE